MTQSAEFSVAVLSPLHPTHFGNIVDWGRMYSHYDRFPVEAHVRFGIGLYQIHQGMSWHDNGVNKYESFAAAIIHFVLCANKVGLDLALQLPSEPIKEYARNYIEGQAYEILRNISLAQQHLYYRMRANKIKRTSRYSADLLLSALENIVLHLLTCIPQEIRAQTFTVATEIMLKELK